MRVVVTGATGQLGQALVRAAPGDVELTAFTRANLDICAPESVATAIEEARPDVVVNAAGYTQVDAAESHRDEAFAVNRDGAASLARAASRMGARLIHISTDFVFSGRACEPYRPEDEPAPMSVYGASKLAGEQAVLAEYGTTVIRTAWLYSTTRQNFALKMLRLMREGKDIRVVSDQVGTPTWCGTLADAVWRCHKARPDARVLHWTDLGVASWYDFAVAIQDIGLDLAIVTKPVNIAPIATAEYPTPATRPAYSVLESAPTRRVLGLPGTHWRHALRSMLEELAGA